ncbi:tRNA adenosine(34) deaminase TadA [Bergeriella denitrificans]|uniref:tRNA-specific adenosine deaminase n=1 Tax=Bergeriella denitrificans TaxID=494 RepID=A0A378UFL1_BERDE|nr:tRNA adenosine(34) deaminase TadA [Bergeriella denitrificans]STZ75960.1 cytosine deaminase [Bergeriella denitrificans]
MLTTPPIAPKTLLALQRLGIHTSDDLRRFGSAKTFLLLKAAGLTLTYSTLWQLEALLLGIRPQELDAAQKHALKTAVKNHAPVAMFPMPSEMERFMQAALAQARQAAALGEIPVGAVVVKNGEIIAAAHNSCIGDHNISHHAEIRALAQAGAALQNYRLEDCDVYITLEPCCMCASALIQARVKRVVYGASEPKTGAAGSVLDVFGDIRLNRHTAVLGGVSANECQAVLQRFFDARRGNSASEMPSETTPPQAAL